MSDRIGSDILGYSSLPKMSPKKKKELEQKVKEELAKKKQEEDKEKLPNLPVPNDLPEARAGEADYDKMKDVHVDEHYRGKPKKKKTDK